MFTVPNPLLRHPRGCTSPDSDPYLENCLEKTFFRCCTCTPGYAYKKQAVKSYMCLYGGQIDRRIQRRHEVINDWTDGLDQVHVTIQFTHHLWVTCLTGRRDGLGHFLDSCVRCFHNTDARPQYQTVGVRPSTGDVHVSKLVFDVKVITRSISATLLRLQNTFNGINKLRLAKQNKTLSHDLCLQAKASRLSFKTVLRRSKLTACNKK